MSEMGDITKGIIGPEERKRLIEEMGQIKDVLDSFKYGLNFEEFADELFKTVNRVTIEMKKLNDKMDNIAERMEHLEEQLKEGIKVRVSGLSETASEALESGQEVVIDEPQLAEDTPSEEELIDKASHKELEKQAAELHTKIARLFEKENELLEMTLNDPAGADEYNERARVAKEMRAELEAQLKKIEEQLHK
jgi:chromosome segregation ATPase